MEFITWAPKFKGERVYLYRMVNSDGETIDFYLSRIRDATAAKRCVSGSLRLAWFKPRKINSDGSAANAKAVMVVNAELSPSEVGPAKPI